jgi:hypothetical protein
LYRLALADGQFVFVFFKFIFYSFFLFSSLAAIGGIPRVQGLKGAMFKEICIDNHFMYLVGGGARLGTINVRSGLLL